MKEAILLGRLEPFLMQQVTALILQHGLVEIKEWGSALTVFIPTIYIHI